MIDNCCLNCPKRSPTCHIDCPDYTRAVEKNNAELERRHFLQKSAAIGNVKFIFARRKQKSKTEGYNYYTE